MKQHGSLRSDAEATAAAYEAGKGALVGATKWGLVTAALGIIGLSISPIYRGLTFQFKVFIQMSGMTLGGMIEADRRLRGYEAYIRSEKKRLKDEATWKKWENLVQEEKALERVEKPKTSGPAET